MEAISIQGQSTWEPDEAADTLGDVIRRKLADAILAGTFDLNQRLDEQELANRFGASRTPVREALRQLAAAGLVEIRPRRGAIVVPADPIRVGQSFEAAAELEALSAAWAAQRGSLLEKSELTDLGGACEAALEQDDPEAFAAANRNLHDKIAALAKNESLAAATRHVRVQTAPYQRAQFRSAPERRQSQTDHREIISAICEQDSEAAKRAMKKHILRASLLALRNIRNAEDERKET